MWGLAVAAEAGPRAIRRTHRPPRAPYAPLTMTRSLSQHRVPTGRADGAIDY